MVFKGVPVKIESKGLAGRCSLVVDGVDIANITQSFRLERSVGDIALLTVELAGIVPNAEADALLALPDELTELLLKLGWAPPWAQQARSEP